MVRWLVRILFCVDAINSVRQGSSVSRIINGDIGGIHKHSCYAGFGCWFFSCYVGCCVKWLRHSQRVVYTYYIIQHI